MSSNGIKNMSNSSWHQIDVGSKKIVIKMEKHKIFQFLTFLRFHKILNFLPILTFLVSIPLIRPRQTRFCHQKSLFVNFSENLFFWPLGGRFKSGFFELFSKLGKDIDKQFSPADHPLCASPESQSNHGTKTTPKREKSKKPIFKPPKNTKNRNISTQSVYPAKSIFYASS